MLIKINDGESVTVQMNHDKSELPKSYTIIRRGDWISVREFSKNTNSAQNEPTTKDKIGDELNKDYVNGLEDMNSKQANTILEQKQKIDELKYTKSKRV